MTASLNTQPVSLPSRECPLRVCGAGRLDASEDCDRAGSGRFDCADLTEHISSRQAGIDDQAWAGIICLAGLGGTAQQAVLRT